MMYDLMIVEAPPKAKKIEEILKSLKMNFKVLASYGHINKLPDKRYGLNFNNNKIDVEWEIDETKKNALKEIKEYSKNANKIYIATDDDREGEKIAKDLVEYLGLDDYERITFTSISEKKIKSALANPRKISESTTKSAVARRVIDRDVGYPVSSIMKFDLKKKGFIVPDNLGCGRIISPALHILNENQKMIDNFVEEEYKRIKVRYIKEGISFQGLFDVRFMIKSEANMMQLQLIKEQMQTNPHTVMRYTPKTREEAPPLPLTAMTLQESCSNLYHFKGKYTMQLAQLLYYLGYISYHRTDSYEQDEETYLEIIDYLSSIYDEDDILISKRKVKKENKNSQEGHESIRPLYIDSLHSPENFKDYLIKKDMYYEKNEKTERDKKNKYKLNQDHLKVYDIIWFRTIAFQMQNAVYDASEVVIDISGNKIKIIANMLKVIKLYDGGDKTLSGWLTIKNAILESSTKNNENSFTKDPVFLPEFTEGDTLEVVEISTFDGKTERPHFYGEGRLIKKIVSSGIARPSTLATILPSLEEKKCIIYDSNIIKITRLGQVVDDWISENAYWLIDLEMAQQFEDSLDKIAKNENDVNDIDMIMDYHERIELLREQVGFYEEEKQVPYEWQIQKALEIANKNNIQLGEELLEDKAKLEIFLSNNLPKREYDSLGKCPDCKKGKIKEYDKNFGCSEFRNGCKFTLWKNNITQFFERFGVDITDSYMQKVIIAALKKEPLLYMGLRSQKNEKFNAYIDIKYNKEHKRWSMNLKFEDKNIKKEDIKNTVIEVKSIGTENLKNFKKYSEFKLKLEKYFNIEGSASLCCGKFFIIGLENVSFKDMAELGLTLKEFVQNNNAEFFIDEDRTCLYMLSFQASSIKFKEIMYEFKDLISEKIGEGFEIMMVAEYRRFCNSPFDLETQLDKRAMEIDNSNKTKVIDRGDY